MKYGDHIISFIFQRIHTWAFSKVTLNIDILSFPIALGVIVFSYTSQIFVCTLEGNMLDRSKFHCMLNWSHIAAAVFKAAFGYIGFVTFQEVSNTWFSSIFVHSNLQLSNRTEKLHEFTISLGRDCLYRLLLYFKF